MATVVGHRTTEQTRIVDGLIRDAVRDRRPLRELFEEVHRLCTEGDGRDYFLSRLQNNGLRTYAEWRSPPETD